MILEIPKNAETILHILENAGYEAYVSLHLRNLSR